MKKLFFGMGLILVISLNVYAQEPGGVKVCLLAKGIHSWNGDVLPNYPKGRPEITILKIIIPPKARLAWHKHPVINAGVLLKGELTVVTQDKKILHLKAGDSLIEVINKWHYGKNEGNNPAEIIVFYAGIKGKPITIRKMGQ